MGGKKKKKKKGKKKKSRPEAACYESGDEPDFQYICDHLNQKHAQNLHIVRSEKYHSHFTCGICNQIVMEPRECSKCQQMFCKLCINQWVSNKNNVQCPTEKQCEEPVYEKIHKFELDILQDLRFQCQVQGCSQQLEEVGEEGYIYQKALQHLKQCMNIPQLCKLQCGEKLLSSEMAKHQETCPKKEVKICQKCNLPMRMDPHDCIEEMKQYLQAINIKHERLKEDFGLNEEVKNLRCTLGHSLRVHYGLIREVETQPNCHICAQERLDMHHHFFRCEGTVKVQVPHNHYDENDNYVQGTKEEEQLCLQSICRMCALLNCDPPRLIDEHIYIQPTIHKHQLKKIESNDNGQWVCHQSSNKANKNSVEQQNQCLSGIQGPGQTQHIQGFVSTYDETFFMCLKCVLQHQCEQMIQEEPEYYNNTFWSQDLLTNSLDLSMDQLMDEYQE